MPNDQNRKRASTDTPIRNKDDDFGPIHKWTDRPLVRSGLRWLRRHVAPRYVTAMLVFFTISFLAWLSGYLTSILNYIDNLPFN